MDIGVSVRLAMKARSVSETWTTVADVRVSTARGASTPSTTSDASVMSVTRASSVRQTSTTVQARLVLTTARAMIWSPTSRASVRPASLADSVPMLSRRASTCPSMDVGHDRVSTVPRAFCCQTVVTSATASLATRDTTAATWTVR